MMEDRLPAHPPERKILKVHELTGAVRRLLERNFSDLWVEGEISGLSQPASGHLYFSLKDRDAKIKAIIFRAHRRFLKFIPKEGDAVLIRGHLSLYEPRGEYQLICDYIEPRGVGALQAAFEALKEALQKEGLFDLDRKRPIPRVAARVGLVTSSSGAAIQDILKVVAEGGFRCSLLLHPVAVQGWGAASQIAQAIDTLNQVSRQSRRPLGLLIVARGGGSLEDLWAFNEEPVARAIARSKIPIISAIGHESDTTLSDYAADFRAPTPSVAAEMVVQNGMAAEEAVCNLQDRLTDQMKRQMDETKRRIGTALRLLVSPARRISPLRDQAGHLTVRLQQAVIRLIETQIGKLTRVFQDLLHLNPIQALNTFKQELQQMSERLFQAQRQDIGDRRARIQSQMEQLNLLSPLNILGRGYSITRKLPTLSIVRRAADVDTGDPLQITLHRGALTCRVDRKELP